MKDTSEESLAIKEPLETYFRGIYEGSAGMLHGIYDPHTLLFCDLEGQPRTKTLVLYLNGVAHRQSPRESGKPFKAEILSVYVVNSIAIGRVQVNMHDSNFEELLSLHKTDGRWLIVNKMVTCAPK
jgi:hypothetical protein